MRISSSLIFQTGLKTINMQQSDLLHLYQQIGTGQNMVTPSDDPLGAAQSINLSQSQSLNNRFGDNRAVAMRNLATEEDALTSLTLLLQDVRTRVVEAGNGTMSDADRATLSAVLQKARDEALGIANTTDGNGQYLFSGSKGNTPAFSDAGVYQGDSQQRNVQADQTRQIPQGDIGSDIFQRAQPGTIAYTSSAAVTNNGTAVLGKPAVIDHNSNWSNTGAEYKFQIDFIDDTNYQVTVFDSTGAAQNLLTGQLNPGDSKIEFTGYGTKVDISGTPAANDSFVVEPLKNSDVNLFDSLDNLIDALASTTDGNPKASAALWNVLNSTNQQLASIYDNVLTVRSSIGARMNELEALDNTGVQRNLGYTKALSDIEDLDYYEASMKLSLRSMALEGAGMAFQKIQALSLFNRAG